MKKLAILFVFCVAGVTAPAQNLTLAQKQSDFQFLASLYATYYAPYEWKKQLLGFDMLNIKPWLDRVAATKTDLDFYEICVEYVASLADTHDTFSLPSDFLAQLGVIGDIYDGKVLIESINRTLLPLARFPLAVGDEIVSIDGTAIEQLLKDFAKYAAFKGNPISIRRSAATRATSRPQSVMPHAPDVGVSAKVVVRRQSGALETYDIPWTKTGTPLEVGPVPSPNARAHALAPPSDARAIGSNEPDYMSLLNQYTHSGVNASETGVLGLGARNPVFLAGFPATFTRRLGGNAADFFYSGTFKYEDLTIGYIRIPNYAPPSNPVALQQFEREIDFMNSNTNGLIVDEMRNTGGNLCFGEDIAARLIPYQFHATGFQLRAYWTRVLGFYNSMIAAKAAGAPQDVIARYEMIYNAMAAANAQQRGLSETLPLCTSSLNRDPATDASGNIIAYKKPLMFMVDEFSLSTADSVAAMIQDAGRGILYGMRTNGAGGNNTSYDAGPFSEGFTGMTLALQVRKGPVRTPDYPTTAYIENVGVRPEWTRDFMTKDNLLQNGAPFVKGFLDGMAGYIRLGPNVPSISSGGIVNSANRAAGISPGTVVEIDGANLSLGTCIAQTEPWPAQLACSPTRVAVGDRDAQLYYVSPGQINAQIPSDLALGSVNVTVFRGGVQSNTVAITLDRVAPGLYTANASGSGVAAGFSLRVAANGTPTVEYLFDPAKPLGSRVPVPVDLGTQSDQVFLSLNGTGFRGATGQATATVGGLIVPVVSVTTEQELDVVHIGPMPRSLAGRGEVSIVVTFNDKPTNVVTASFR
jgi:uncharacterized protein (TIGR03437 family)